MGDLLHPNLLRMQNVNDNFHVLQTVHILMNFFVQKRLHYVQRMENIIYVLLTVQKWVNVNIHESIYCMYIEIRLDMFCIHCKTLWITRFKKICNICSLTSGNWDTSFALNGYQGQFPSFSSELPAKEYDCSWKLLLAKVEKLLAGRTALQFPCKHSAFHWITPSWFNGLV